MMDGSGSAADAYQRDVPTPDLPAYGTECGGSTQTGRALPIVAEGLPIRKAVDRDMRTRLSGKGRRNPIRMPALKLKSG
jgi:hypothetical protein